MKAMAVIGYIFAGIWLGAGAVVAFSSSGSGYDLAIGAGGGFSLALLSSVVLGIGQMQDAQKRILDVLLFVSDVEYADVRVLNEAMRGRSYPTDEALIANGYFRTEGVLRKKQAGTIQKAS